MERNNVLQQLLGASTVRWTLWLSRNVVICDNKCQTKSFLQGLYIYGDVLFGYNYGGTICSTLRINKSFSYFVLSKLGVDSYATRMASYFQNWSINLNFFLWYILHLSRVTMRVVVAFFIEETIFYRCLINYEFEGVTFPY